MEKKSLTATTQEYCEQYQTCPGGSTPQSSSCTTTYHQSRKPSKLDESDMQDTTGEVGRSKGWTDQLEPTFNGSVPKQDVALKIYRERWTIETGGERGSGKSALAARHDDEDYDVEVLLTIMKLRRTTGSEGVWIWVWGFKRGKWFLRSGGYIIGLTRSL